MFNWIFKMLAHSNNSQVDMLLHSDTLSWFWANQSLFLLLKGVWLAEKYQIPIVYSFVWRDMLEGSMLIINSADVACVW